MIRPDVVAADGLTLAHDARPLGASEAGTDNLGLRHVSPTTPLREDVTVGNRVLHVAAVDFTATKLLAPQLHALGSAGYDVRLAVGRTDERFWGELGDLDPVDIAFPRGPRPLSMLGSTARLRRLVRDWQPDVLHLHTPAASAPVRALPRRAWPRDMRIFYTVHGYLHPWPTVTNRQRAAQRLEQWQSRRTDCSLFQSAEDLDEATRRGYGSRLVYLGNGVESSWFEQPTPAPKAAGKLSVLFVGRLVKEKGVLDLIEAVAHVDGVELHVAGAALPSDRDPVDAELRHEVAHRGLGGRVHLHGMLRRTEVQQLMQRADAVVLPSYREGVPRSLIEGMATGRPGLATRIRGCREIISHESDGLLVDPGAVDQLATGLQQLRDMAESDFAAMGRRAQSSTSQRFRETQVIERLVAAYQDAGVLPQDRRRRP